MLPIWSSYWFYGFCGFFSSRFFCSSENWCFSSFVNINSVGEQNQTKLAIYQFILVTQSVCFGYCMNFDCLLLLFNLQWWWKNIGMVSQTTIPIFHWSLRHGKIKTILAWCIDILSWWYPTEIKIEGNCQVFKF